MAGFKTQNMLAQYAIPLGANEATIVFTGKQLSPADFDELIEYVKLFKKQFERRSDSTEPEDKEAE